MNWALPLASMAKASFRRAAGKIQGHQAAIVGANRIGPVKGLGGPSATYGVSVQFAVGQIPAPSAVNLPTAAKNRREGTVPLIPLNVNA